MEHSSAALATRGAAATNAAAGRAGAPPARPAGAGELRACAGAMGDPGRAPADDAWLTGRQPQPNLYSGAPDALVHQRAAHRGEARARRERRRYRRLYARPGYSDRAARA